MKSLMYVDKGFLLNDINNRPALNISDFDFLLVFKKPNEKVYFRLIQGKKAYSEKL